MLSLCKGAASPAVVFLGASRLSAHLLTRRSALLSIHRAVQAASISGLLGQGRRALARLSLSTMPAPQNSATDKWWDGNTVAVITGANKGIGAAIALQLAREGLKTVVTARNEELGQEATKKIGQAAGASNVLFRRLDIADPASVDEFAAWAKEHLGSIDILVNNAGIAFKGNVFGAEEARTTMATNFEGTRAVCERIAPLMPKGGRIVNVCSLAGKLSILKGRELRARFEAASSPEQVAELAGEFLQGVADNTYSKQGWPGSMYGVSKLCEATYTRVLAEQLKERGIAAYACCPGYVATDMSSWKGYKTVEQGAETPVWLALRCPLERTGRFFSNCKEEPF